VSGREQILLISVFGRDQSGITAELTSVLADHRINVLDIGQSVIHSTLALGLLVEVPGEELDSSLRETVTAKCDELGLSARFDPVPGDSYQRWVDRQGQTRYIVTLLARKLTADQLARLTDTVSRFGLNIDGITRLSGRIPLGELPPLSKACVEFSVRGTVEDPAAFRADLVELSAELDIDLAFQRDDMYRRNRRLVVFDMDSTLIETEVIDELARMAGVGDQVAEITEQAMRGELDFQASFRQRVALLKGLDATVLESIARDLPITEGAERLLRTLSALGFKTAILSGGFTYFAEELQRRLGFDYVYANELDVRDGKVTGEVIGDIVDGERKAKLLREIAQREGIALEQAIAVGDGANDLPMLSIAGLGIAFRAKPVVKQQARHSISRLGLDAILYLLGMSDRHQPESK